MRIIIVGGGQLGSYLAGLLESEHEKVVLIEKEDGKIDRLKSEFKNVIVISGDGSNPDVLKSAGIHDANVVVAATGHDEENLMVCQLAKFEFGVEKVISRINNPKNEWLFVRDMGVDAAVSGARILAKLIEEETGISHLTTILNLSEGKISLVKCIVEINSEASHKEVKDLELPTDSVLVTLVRENKASILRGNSRLLPGDEVLCIVSDEHRLEIENIFSSLPKILS